MCEHVLDDDSIPRLKRLKSQTEASTYKAIKAIVKEMDMRLRSIATMSVVRSYELTVKACSSFCLQMHFILQMFLYIVPISIALLSYDLLLPYFEDVG